MTDHWLETTVQLKFRLGEKVLFSAHLNASACTIPFTQISTNPQYPEPPYLLFSRGVEVIIVRSHPISGGVPVFSRTQQAFQYVPVCYDRHYVDLRGSFESYLGKFSSKTRSSLQRKVRKFAELNGGKLEWKEYRTGADMREFHTLARSVSVKTYQERLLNSGLPDSDRFVEEMIKRAEEGTARGYLLFLGNEAISYIYCPIVDGTLFYDVVGFDPAHSKSSPGTVLQYLVLEKLFGEGKFVKFDFTEGEGNHKVLFATHAIACADIYFFRPTPFNACIISGHWFLDTISLRLAALLDRIGLKSKLKRLMRKHM